MNTAKRFALLITLVAGIVVGLVVSARFDLIPHLTAADSKVANKVVDAVKPNPAAESLQEAFVTTAKNVKPCVVNISTTKTVKFQNPLFDNFFNDDFMRRFFGEDNSSPFGGRQQEMKQTSLGSGFIIRSDGYILTNYHVVGQADEILVKIASADNAKEYKAEIVGSDPESDLAVIKLKTSDTFAAARLGNSDDVRVGDWVIAVGNPFGFEGTVTAGIISAKSRSNVGQGAFEDFLQTDAAINPGNSGGPLINIRGEVIGVNTAIYSNSGGYMGVGFAIPINLAKDIVDDLVDTGHYSRGYLGITFQDLDDRLARANGLPDAKSGVLVTNVLEDTPADRAGIKEGDIITGVNDTRIESGKQLQKTVAGFGAGKKVKIAVLRDGKKKSFDVKLAERPSQAGGSSPASPSKKPVLGLELEPLTSKLARQLNAKTTTGLVVTNVKSDTPADEAGIQQGDIIVKVNRKTVRDLSDFNEYIDAANPGDDVLLVVERGGYNKFLVITIPAN